MGNVIVSLKRTALLFSLVIISCCAKEAARLNAEDAASAIPEPIARILDSDPEIGYYRVVHNDLAEYHNGRPDFILDAMRMAFRSCNDTLVVELIKHYQKLPGWNYVDIYDASHKDIRIIKLLLESGLGIDSNLARDAYDTTLAKFAETSDDPAVLQLLIDNGAKINTEDYQGWPRRKLYRYSSVYNAARAGKAGNLRVLIENGGNINLPDNMFFKKPLIAAAENGSHECVALLIDAGADVLAVNEESGRTALMAAAESGNEQSVKLLLDNGAERSINARDAVGFTAVMEAAISGNPESLAMLIEKGGDVNAALVSSWQYAHTDWYMNRAPAEGDKGGQSALMMARGPECVKLLLEAGANVNAKDKAGRNALLFQCFFYRESETVSLLINSGACLYLDKDGGRNLLALARSEWCDYRVNPEIIGMLLKAGCADENPAHYDTYDYYFQPDRR